MYEYFDYDTVEAVEQLTKDIDRLNQGKNVPEEERSKLLDTFGDRFIDTILRVVSIWWNVDTHVDYAFFILRFLEAAHKRGDT
jgi:hypothetical protein